MQEISGDPIDSTCNKIWGLIKNNQLFSFYLIPGLLTEEDKELEKVETEDYNLVCCICLNICLVTTIHSTGTVEVFSKM